jgi:uncharacterized repeat protein (TIGR01451 family)
MNESSIRTRGKTRTTLSRVYAFALSVFMLLAFTAGGAHAAAPIAGTDISNQATASYFDSVQNKTVSVQSNSVHTTVQQVASLTLAIDAQTQSVSIGGTVYFKHTVTNTGNGSDVFNLAAVKASGSATISVPATIFSDTGSGAGAALAPAQTITLAPGATFSFYYSAVASNGAVATDTATATVTATSTFPGAVKATNTDTITINPFANLAINKYIDTVTTVGNTTTIQYRIHYVNNGNNTASTFAITDPTPAGTVYSPASAWWSVTGNGTKFVDASQIYSAGANSITYQFAANTITATINQILAGAQGDVTYQVTFPATTAGNTVITNTANYTYIDGAGHTPSGSASVNYTIPTVRSVVLDDVGSTTDSDAANGTVLVATAPQGGVVWFDNVVHNTGNVADTYVMSYSGSTFPASTIQYYDGLNGSILPGGVTGSVPVGGTTHVWVGVTLTTAGTGGPFQLTLKATSSNNPAVSGTDTDKLTGIAAAAVDITSNSVYNAGAPALGQGPGPEGGAVTTTAGSNAAPAVFTLYINNIAQTAETFALSASATTSFSPAVSLPAGWTVTFNAPTGSGGTSCSSYGAVLGTTATISGGNNALVCAVVSPPAGATGGGATQVYFKATGSNTGASDVIHNAVTVAKAYSLTITPNNSGQIAPNGSKVYSHTVTNNSNLPVGTLAGDLVFSTVDTKAGWTTVLYADAGLTTVLTDLNQLVGVGGLAANGGTVSFYVKVQSPATALGDQDITTINLTSTKSSPSTKIVATASDTTTMAQASLTIQKFQALDANCNNTGLSYAQTDIAGGAVPGACIRYKMVVNNAGNQAATQVAVTDLVPAYTVYNKIGTCFPGTGGTTGASGDIDGTTIVTGSISEPAACAPAGAGVAVTFGTGTGLTLNSGSTATLYFEVQIAK